MPPRTRKYEPKKCPLHSGKPIQANVGRRVSLTQQERRKRKASGRSHNCRIKCKKATFSAALMCRRQANSVTLASATHRRTKEMSDGTGTQVKVQMANKCKVLINPRRLYKRRRSPWWWDGRFEEKRKGEREKNSIVCKQNKRCMYTSPRTDILSNVSGIFSRSTYCMANIWLKFTSSSPSSVTHSLQIYCLGTFGSEPLTCWAWVPKTRPHNWRRLWEEFVSRQVKQ